MSGTYCSNWKLLWPIEDRLHNKMNMTGIEQISHPRHFKPIFTLRQTGLSKTEHPEKREECNKCRAVL